MTWVGGIYIATHMNMKELGLSEIVKNRKDQKKYIRGLTRSGRTQTWWNMMIMLSFKIMWSIDKVPLKIVCAEVILADKRCIS